MENRPLVVHSDLVIKLDNVQIDSDNKATVTFSLRQDEATEIVKLPVEVENFNDLLDQCVTSAKRIIARKFGEMLQKVQIELREIEDGIRKGRF